MMRRITSSLALVACVFGAAASCERSPTGPQPGALRVRLNMPVPNSGNDGAIQFTVSGPGIPSAPTGGAGLQAYYVVLGTTSEFAVVGTLTNNATILTIQVPDARQQYSATIEQVAASTYQLRALTGYAITVVP